MYSMAMAETRKYRNSITGKIAELTEEQASVWPEYQEPVAEDAKPYVTGMFRPGKVGEFDNPEPPTDRQAEAQKAYDDLSAQLAPNSKAVREAKAALDAANEQAEADREEAVREAEAERVRLEEEEAAAAAAAADLAGQTPGDQAGPTGDTNSEGN